MKSQILRFSETCFVDFFFSLPFFPFWRGPSSERNTNQHFCAVFGLQTQTNSFKDFEAVLPERAASWPQLMLGHSWLSIHLNEFAGIKNLFGSRFNRP